MASVSWAPAAEPRPARPSPAIATPPARTNSLRVDVSDLQLDIFGSLQWGLWDYGFTGNAGGQEPLAGKSREAFCILIPPYSPSLPERLRGHAADDISVLARLDRSIRLAPVAHAIQKVSDVRAACGLKCVGLPPFTAWFHVHFGALRVKRPRFAPQIESRLVAVELLHLIIAGAVSHRFIGEGENQQKIFRKLHRHAARFGNLPALHVQLAARAGHRQRIFCVHHPLHTVGDVRRLPDG